MQAYFYLYKLNQVNWFILERTISLCLLIFQIGYTILEKFIYIYVQTGDTYRILIFALA